MIFSEKPVISFLYMDTHSQQSRRNDDFLSFHSISFSLRLHKFYLATFRRDFTVGVGETKKIQFETYNSIYISTAGYVRTIYWQGYLSVIIRAI